MITSEASMAAKQPHQEEHHRHHQQHLCSTRCSFKGQKLHMLTQHSKMVLGNQTCKRRTLTAFPASQSQHKTLRLWVIYIVFPHKSSVKQKSRLFSIMLLKHHDNPCSSAYTNKNHPWATQYIKARLKLWGLLVGRE